MMVRGKGIENRGAQLLCRFLVLFCSVVRNSINLEDVCDNA
jgi:hypothetical protein